jgi:hypothetical protein
MNLMSLKYQTRHLKIQMNHLYLMNLNYHLSLMNHLYLKMQMNH